MKNILKLLPIILFYIIVSCQKENDTIRESEKTNSSDTYINVPSNKNNAYLEKEFTWELMKEVYYWNLSLEKRIDLNLYTDAQDLLDNNVYSLDKWSFVMKTEEAKNLFGAAKYAGLGAKFIGLNNSIYTYLIYNQSDFYKNGITGRAWKVLEIDGISVNYDNFVSLIGVDTVGVNKTFKLDSAGIKIKTIVVTKKQMIMNTVTKVEIFNLSNTIIGFLAFDQFLEPSKEELNTAFEYFIKCGVKKMIIDLRSNGGGSVEVAEKLCGHINGNISGQFFIEYKFNANLFHLNTKYRFFIDDISNKLTCSDVVFLTSKNTASASELVINSMKPYVKVKIIGTKTHGKACGMYSFDTGDITNYYDIFKKKFTTLLVNQSKYSKLNLTVFPITFVNGDYFSGIAVDYEIQDDYLTPIGDKNEPLLKAALEYLSGKTPFSKKNFFVPNARSIEYKKGLYRATCGSI